MAFVMGGRCPHNCCFVRCCLQDLFNTAHSILVQLLLNFLSIHSVSIHVVHLYVTYWPSTKPSIKRCTCINKRKNSGSRWTSNKNITWTQTAWVSWSWSQLGTRCRSESQRQTEGFGSSVTHGWATPAKMRKKCCHGQKYLGQCVAVCPRLPSPLTHNQHQPFRE